MTDYSDKQAFIELMVEQKVLRFGDFKLKSGRRSPYFFDLGAISDGAALAALGEFYAQAIDDYRMECDVLFGPAYKGIPIAVATGVALARRGLGVGIGVAFDRKEAKDHGEGGVLVGAGLSGRRVLLVDDVVTDASTKFEGAQLIGAQGGELAGVLIALDRQEKLDGDRTAFKALQSPARRSGAEHRDVARRDLLAGHGRGGNSGARRPDRVDQSLSRPVLRDGLVSIPLSGNGGPQRGVSHGLAWNESQPLQRSVRQPEHALCDDVSLNLAAAAVNGYRTIVQPKASHLAFLCSNRLQVRAEAPRAAHPCGQVVELLLQFAAIELED